MSKIANPQVGQRLRQVREHRGMSQGLLARTIGVAIGTIQSYERGRIRITADRFDQLARALQCEVIDLLMPPGSALPKYRFASSRNDGNGHSGQGDALEHLTAIWEELRSELRDEKAIEIGDQPARDWINAIRKRMGDGAVSAQTARYAYVRIRRRLEAYHELLKAERRTYEDHSAK